MLTLPTDTADALDGVSTSYDALLDGVENCTRNVAEGVTSIVGTDLGFSDVVGAIFDELSITSDVVDSLVDDVQDEVDDLNEDVLSQLVDYVSHKGSYPAARAERSQSAPIGPFVAGVLVKTLSPLLFAPPPPLTCCLTYQLGDVASQVQGVTDAIDTTEGIRKGLVWPIISLSILMIVIFVAIALGTYEFVAWGIKDCDYISCFVFPCAIVIVVIIWLITVAAVSLSGETRALRSQTCGSFAPLVARYGAAARDGA